MQNSEQVGLTDASATAVDASHNAVDFAPWWLETTNCGRNWRGNGPTLGPALANDK